MALEIRKSSKWWYGRYQVGRKVHCVNLRVEIAGRRPKSVGLESDGAFERSRGVAQSKLDALIEEVINQRQAEVYVQRLHEIRTGRKIDSIALSSFSKQWEQAPRKRKGSARYVWQVRQLFERFTAFLNAHHPEVKTLADVTPDMAEAFIVSDRKRGVSARTSNAALILLRSAFKVLGRRANIVRNPFEGIPTLDEQTTHRKPFNQEELSSILKAAAADSLIGPVVVTGICTAMRRGDCCTLRWADVDLDEGFIRVKTSKTRETAEIPMFPLLRNLLASRRPAGKIDPEEYVFSEAARMHLENAQGVSYRVRKLFAAAGFFDAAEDSVEVADNLQDCDQAELQKQICDVLKNIKPRRRERIQTVFSAYVGGETLPKLAQRLGIAKSTASMDLHALEALTGCRIITKSKKSPSNRGMVTVAPASGLRRVSIRDFHSFRVTWITIALAAGVPLEIVQRVTGHRTVDVVLKHYFRPGREDFRRTLENAMPQLFLGTAETKSLPAAANPQSDAEELAALAAKLAAGSASEADRARFRELAAGV